MGGCRSRHGVQVQEKENKTNGSMVDEQDQAPKLRMTERAGNRYEEELLKHIKSWRGNLDDAQPHTTCAQ